MPFLRTQISRISVRLCVYNNNAVFLFILYELQLRVESQSLTYGTRLSYKIEEEERKLEAAISETEKQCAEVTSELKELELKSSRFKELEER